MDMDHKIDSEPVKKYSVEIHLGKDITKEQIHQILKSDLPDKLKGANIELVNNMGYSHDMDVIVADGQVRKFIELHAPYGHEFEPFLMQLVYSCVKRGFAVTDIRFYM